MPINLTELVRIADGELVRVEMYQRGLKEAGVESQVVGEQLEAGLGTALPRSIELWVRQEDQDKARECIARMESDRGRESPPYRPRFTHPESDPKPHPSNAPHTHTHYDADPRS